MSFSIYCLYLPEQPHVTCANLSVLKAESYPKFIKLDHNLTALVEMKQLFLK